MTQRPNAGHGGGRGAGAEGAEGAQPQLVDGGVEGIVGELAQGLGLAA
jgi:hypothetical protein